MTAAHAKDTQGFYILDQVVAVVRDRIATTGVRPTRLYVGRNEYSVLCNDAQTLGVLLYRDSRLEVCGLKVYRVAEESHLECA